MKLRQLFENDGKVIDFPVRPVQRTYGANGYKTITQQFQSASDGIEPRTLTPLHEPPLIKFNKRPSSAAFFKALSAAGVPKDMHPKNVEISSFDHEDGKGLHIHPMFYGAFTGDRAFVNKRIQVAKRLFNQALPKIFGNTVSKFDQVGMGKFPIAVFSSEFLKSKGMTTALPPITVAIKTLFKKHNMGGLMFTKVTRTKSGYTVRFEGVELVDQSSLNLLDSDLRSAFGDLFIRWKHDGEISAIGHRSVGPGLTNYRLYFLHDVVKLYKVS